MNFITNRIVNEIIQRKYVSIDKHNVIFYGVRTGLEVLINLLCVAVIMLLVDDSIFVLSFLIAFSLLRFYTGGVHSNSFIICLVFSNLTILFVAWKQYLIHNCSHIWFNTILIFIICVCSPQSSAKRNLSEKEISIFTKRRNILLLLYLIIISVVEENKIVLGIQWSLVTNAFSLILGKVKGMRISK